MLIIERLEGQIKAYRQFNDDHSGILVDTLVDAKNEIIRLRRLIPKNNNVEFYK